MRPAPRAARALCGGLLCMAAAAAAAPPREPLRCGRPGCPCGGRCLLRPGQGLLCAAPGECGAAEAACAAGGPCDVDCSAPGSCRGLSVVCGGARPCRLRCGGVASCTGARVASAGGAEVLCSGAGACAGAAVGGPAAVSCAAGAHCPSRAGAAPAPRAAGGLQAQRCPAGWVACKASANCCGVVGCPASSAEPCRQCSAAADCSGNAAEPITSDGSRCQCEAACRNSWEGRDCSLCAAPRGGRDCNGCLLGMVGCPQSVCRELARPVCRQCTSEADCNGRASSVSSVFVPATASYMCTCQCTHAWSGADAAGRLDCSVCPAPYGPGALNSCDACSPGWRLTGVNATTGMPNCAMCTSAADCAGHDQPGTVTSNGISCCCTCRNGWTGDNCQLCPFEYGGADCDECSAQALGSFPLCALRNISVLVPGQSNRSTMDRRVLYAPAPCPGNLTAADWIVECGDDARREALNLYQRRGSSAALFPEAIWYQGDDGSGCVERLWGASMDPADMHIEVCRVVEKGGLSAEFVSAPQTCIEGADKPWTDWPTVARVDPALSYAVTTQGWRGIPAGQNFASRWLGTVVLEKSGNVTFTLSSDDGAMLWIDGFLVIDSTVGNTECSTPDPASAQCFQCRTYRSSSRPVQLAAGPHKVALRHFQADLHAGLLLEARGPHTCGWQRQLRHSELRPLPTFLLWRMTVTQSLSVTPTATGPLLGPLCSALGWTVCSEGYSGELQQWLAAGGLLLVLCATLCAALLCSIARACSRPQPAYRTAAQEPLPADDPPAVPDEEGPAGEEVHVSVRRALSPALPGAARGYSPPVRAVSAPTYAVPWLDAGDSPRGQGRAAFSMPHPALSPGADPMWGPAPPTGVPRPQ
eukprot:TRINITY_DN6391_c0_g1_i1.p1 TRINITY_DN6391_c0_g1~~TRINITY_DN6391_c0_g1_i1.p1  ORF type:complete len:871 (+),score=197.59 TRINITY_DN6391_c0_g1_i1:71-2683(+)